MEISVPFTDELEQLRSIFFDSRKSIHKPTNQAFGRLDKENTI
jgi:hypothetical protein